MNLFVMRHGTTVWNEKGITQGQSQNRLSKNGIMLVKNQAKKYANQKFDIIVCSPLMRTVQTANIMNFYHNVKIVKDQKLIEGDQGYFAGKRKDNLTDFELTSKNARSKEFGMEGFDEVEIRVRDFLKTLKQKYPYENVLIVTHNVNATFIDYILRNEPFDAKKYSSLKIFENAEIKSYKF